MSKLVVFDIDGTILNSWGFFEKLVLDYSDKSNLPKPCIDTIALGYGDPNSHDFGWGVSKPEQLEHLHSIWKIADKESLVHIPELFKGTEDTLIHLKDTGHTLAIVTAKPEAPLMEMLEHHGLYTLFSAHRTGCDRKKRNEKEKPAPDMLNSVMRELNFVPDETFMIGDTTMDIGMGLNANTETIGVTWGAHSKELLVGAGAHHIVETEVADIVPIIKESK